MLSSRGGRTPGPRAQTTPCLPAAGTAARLERPACRTGSEGSSHELPLLVPLTKDRQSGKFSPGGQGGGPSTYAPSSRQRVKQCYSYWGEHSSTAPSVCACSNSAHSVECTTCLIGDIGDGIDGNLGMGGPQQPDYSLGSPTTSLCATFPGLRPRRRCVTGWSDYLHGWVPDTRRQWLLAPLMPAM